MIDLLNTIIFTVTVIVLFAVIAYALGSKHQFMATLVDKESHQDGSVMLTFTYPSKNKLELKVGQQILIKTNISKKGRQFTPIQSAVGSFKILIIPSMSVQLDSNEDLVLKELSELKIKGIVYVQIAKNNLQYLGKSQFRIRTASKREYVKKFKSIYILAQGNKIPIAYQIIKGICEEKTGPKPNITVLFVGGGIADFALKNQFEHLQQNYDNIKYFYSLPVKGERQPSIEGLGISSEKVEESFDHDVQSTFCILCAEQSDLCVAVERSLLNKKVSPSQIYKY